MDDKTNTIDIKLTQSSKRPVTFALRLKVDYEKEHSVSQCDVYEAFLPKLMKLIGEMDPHC